MIFTKSRIVLTVTIFLMGALFPLNVNITVTYLYELMPERHHAMTGTLLNTICCLTLMVGSLYFAFISKDAVYLLLTGWVCVLAQVCTIWHLPESPKWLLSVERVQESLHVIEKMARVNGTYDALDPQNIEDRLQAEVKAKKATEAEEVADKQSIAQILKQRVVLVNFIAMTFLIGLEGINYYLLSFSVVSFGSP